MATQKTYVLLEHTRPSAPIYTVVNKQRIKNNAIPKWRPFLQYTFAKEDGTNVTTRLKLNSNTIYQEEQVKEGNIPANAKFTTVERNITKFINGVLVVTNAVVQKFLEEGCPHFKDFKGSSEELITPMFDIYDRKAEVKNQNTLFRKTLEAANKIAKLDLIQSQELLIRIKGVGFVPPDDVDEAQNILVDHMDASEENVDDILKKLLSESENMVILVGYLVAEGVVSFNAKPDEVCKKYGNGWQTLVTISSTEFSEEQRQSQFIDFLLTEDGKIVKETLKKEAAKLKSK